MNRLDETARPRPNWPLRIFLSLLSIAFAALVGFVLTLSLGVVEGEEFSPVDFRRRAFSYVQIPLLGKQLTPIRREPADNTISDYLAAHGLLPPPVSGNDPWHLVWDNRTPEYSSDCDARILCRYLEATCEDGESYWQVWSDRHPDRAVILWQAVAELARIYEYLSIPDLFDAAQRDLPADKYEARIEQVRIQAWWQRAQRLDQAQRREEAAEACEQILQLRDDHPRARELLDRIRDSRAPQDASTASDPA